MSPDAPHQVPDGNEVPQGSSSLARSRAAGRARGPAMFRQLYLLVAAILTVVSGGIASHAFGATGHAGTLAMAAMQSASPLQVAAPSQQWQECSQNQAAYRDPVEADVDDDDGDPRPDIKDDPPVAFLALRSPSRPAGAPHSPPRSSTSRLAMSRGLPRGPPLRIA